MPDLTTGETSTYSRIAEAIGAPKAIRAVAISCSRSWFAFAIPCHRVLHKGGATAQNRRDGRQYRWVDYEAKVEVAQRLPHFFFSTVCSSMS
jgi:AraC family transcriptional regulator, regulatory protein of adaptative response / methylated-DNA-[protein]-cysteine methyltransferase